MAKRARADKKRVGRTKICALNYLNQILPLWLPGPVPNRFWQTKKHRRDYLLWLGHRLGFRRMEDWYRLTYEDFKLNCGQGLAAWYWKSSPVVAVKESFPEHEWHEWLFAQCPMGFWDDRRNRRRYIKWLSEQLGYTCLDDWYNILEKDFLDNYGRQLLNYHHRSPVLAAIDLIPRRNWCEWMFARVPHGFWDSVDNRKRYVRWLGKRLGYRTPEDWCKVRKSDFDNNYGGGLVVTAGSHVDLLREAVPELDRDGR